MGNPEAQLSIVTGMAQSSNSNAPQSAGSLLLAGLQALPTSSPSIPFDAHAAVYACLLLSYLLRNTESCKRMAREVRIGDEENVEPPAVPAHTKQASAGSARPSVDSIASAALAEDDDRVGLVHIVVGNLMMAQREQSQLASNAGGAGTGTAGAHFRLLGEWSRVMVAYLMVLCVWMWESPRSVREFLAEGSNLQVVCDGHV